MNIHRENLFLLVNRSKNQQPAQNIDKRHIKRNKLLLGIFTVLLPLILILVGIYIMLIIIRNHDENLKATRFEIPGLKECKLLRERRHTFVYKQGSISTNVKPVRNIFFIIDDSIMTAKEACAIESALHKFPHRKVYLMQLQCNQSTVPLIKLDYRKILYDYHNAFFVKLEPNEYLSHSPVEGMWNCKNDKAQIAAMAYTAWRFGGSIFTHQILINHRSLLSSRNLKVLITPVSFINSYPCHGFFYMLMNNIAQNNRNFNVNELIDSTILNYNSNYSNPVQNGSELICNNYLCPLISFSKYVKSKASISICQLSHLCPQVIKQYLINTASFDLNQTYFENLK